MVDFSILASETRTYLEHTGATQETPYKRLLYLNTPAVEFYRERGVDLAREMLPIAVCAQHNNGGLFVDGWWQTNVKGLFAVGEVAATHGIYRPGGSALNSGQVGSTRAAEYICAHKKQKTHWTAEDHKAVMSQVRCCMESARIRSRSLDFSKKWKDATSEMSRYGAMLRNRQGMERMVSEISKELEQLDKGQKIEQEESGKIGALSRYFRYLDMRLCQKVYLEAMLDYEKQGGKSRGSAIYMEDKEGMDSITIPELVVFSLDGSDGRAHAGVIQEILYDAKTDHCSVNWRPVHPLSEISESPAFEVVWKNFREGCLYQ